MSGQERANLITESLHRLHAVGVRTVSLTCDGPSCHFAMMRSLGAKLTINDMNPSFPHPADHLLRVYVILDVCHMVKLLRNSFADGLILKTSDGETIRWKYIEELNKLQETEGLRLGNKLKSAHIQWKRQKMKVNLAAQIFSSSVADALQYCNEGLKLPQFAGCEATVTFIRTIDGVFDVLNSRNPLGKGTKAPMKPANKEQTMKTLKDAEHYITGLKDGAGNFMHTGPRKTGYIGFIASIRSVTRLFLELVAAPDAPMKYLLTYKLSQDHLELFFSAVRARGGFNNNPTSRQFQAAYKRLLMRHHVKNGTGNCLVRDDTTVLPIAQPQSTIDLTRKYDLLTRTPLTSEHDYADIPNFETVSPYKDAAISYIAGYVVRMMKRRITCIACTQALTTTETVHAFVALKDRGFLQKPSSSVVIVCKETEKCFQRLLKASDG